MTGQHLTISDAVKNCLNAISHYSQHLSKSAEKTSNVTGGHRGRSESFGLITERRHVTVHITTVHMIYTVSRKKFPSLNSL